MAFRYPKGARVVAAQCIDNFIPEGSTGTVLVEEEFQANDGWVGVAWDDCFTRMHDLDGLCPPNHGWYVYDRFLDEYYENSDVIDLNETDLQDIIFI